MSAVATRLLPHALPSASRSLRPLRVAAARASSHRSLAATARAAMEAVRFGPEQSIPGFITGAKGAPGVIVIQEWWGVNDQVKAHATKLAASGYRVLIPDLYKGKIGVDKEEASHLMGTLDWQVAIGEIKAAASFLKAEGCPKVGITGFCMGGALTLCGLKFSDDIAAAAPFYGIPKAQLCDLSDVAKPVQGHFGAEDGMKGFSDPESARALEAQLRKAGAEAEVFVYPRCGHGFMNDSPAPFDSFEARKAAMGDSFPPFDAEQVGLAWGRLEAFFAKHLKA